MDAQEELKNSLKMDKLVYGTEQAVKNVKAGKIKKLFLSSNCPKQLTEDLKHYAEISGSEIFMLSIPNTELGVVCKKPFAVSVLGVLR